MANKPLEILKFNGDNNNYPIRTLQVVYGICRTAASTAAKQVDVDINTTTGYQTNFQLEKGASVYVYFEQTNSANSPTLQIYNYNGTNRTAISGQTAVPIYYDGAAVPKAYLQAKRVLQFIYDGSYFHLVGYVDTNTNNKTTQTLTSADSGEFPILFKNTANTTDETAAVRYDGALKYQPSTDTLTMSKANISNATVSSLSLTSGTISTTPTGSNDIVNKAYADGLFAANDAMIFKGTIGAAAQSPTVTSLPATHNAGWTYRVVTAGTYAGYNCEVGDLLICIIDGTAANNAHWSAVQYNVDKPAYLDGNTVTDGDLPAFDSTGGRLKDSGYYVNTTQQSIKYVSTWTPGTALKFGDDIPADDITAWNAGTLPTKGTQVTATKINSWDPGELTTWENIGVDDITSWSPGTAPSLTSANVTASHVKTAGSVPTRSAMTATHITAWDSGSSTAGSQSAVYSAGILTFTLEAAPLTSITKPSLTYTGVDFYSITGVGAMPTFEDIIATKITAWSAGSIPSLEYNAKTVSKITSAGKLPTLTSANSSFYPIDSVGTLPSLSYQAKAIPNVVSANVPGTLTTASTAFYALSKR